MFRVTAIFLSFTVASCQAQESQGTVNSQQNTGVENVLVIDRLIDDQLVTDVRRELSTKKYASVRLQSPGGQAISALDLLQLLSKENVAIEVAGMCLSACAEIAILSNKNVKAIGRPILGFHSNAFSNETLLKKFRHDEALTCFRENVLEKYSEFLEKDEQKLLAYAKFSSEIVSYLDFYKSRDAQLVSPRSGCPWIEFASYNKFWFPTSSQMQAYFGNKFDGALASDDESYAKEKISTVFGYSGTIIVGTKKVDLSE